MDWTQQCAVVIPCFNEAARIGELIREVRVHLGNVIIVDDGSTDETAFRAQSAGAEVIRGAGRSGKGSALQTGWRRAFERRFSWVLMLDGDGQHAAQDIPLFIDCANTTGASLIVGNRMGNCAAMPPLRRTVNAWMSNRISALTGISVPDSQCGFRLAHLETLLRLPISANHFEIESEMLVAFATSGQRVAFVPIQTIYEARPSHIHPFADTWRWIRWRVSQRKSRRSEPLMGAEIAPKPLSTT